MITDLLALLFWLFVSHAMGDFALQNNWIATHKSRHNEPAVKSKYPQFVWLHVLTAHAGLHAGFTAASVYVVTNNLKLGVCLGFAEFIAHWLIDFAKSEDKFGFHTDQFLHYLCKVVWALLAVTIST